MKTAGLRTGDPERLGEYDLLGRLGEGGQGAVFLGRARAGRLVAVKLLHAELVEDDRARARFLRELEVAKQVAPFCTAPVIDADLAGDRPYIVSEYVPGPSLARQVAERGPLSGAALERLAIGTATALVSIHQAGIIHRDFKPHNVLLGPDGPRVIDFGVARASTSMATMTSRVIGTPAYISPEQIEGEPATTATDVFCWAATMVFAATGRPPFGRDSIPAVINRVLHKEPDLGDLDGPIAALATACLAKDPAERPEARRILMRLLGQEVAPELPEPAAIEADAILEEAAELASPPKTDITDDLSDLADRTETLAGGFPAVPAQDPDLTTPGERPDRPEETLGGVLAGVLAARIRRDRPEESRPPAGGRRRYSKIAALAGAAALFLVGIVAVVAAAADGPDRDRPSVTTNNQRPATSPTGTPSGPSAATSPPAGTRRPAPPPPGTQVPPATTAPSRTRPPRPPAHTKPPTKEPTTPTSPSPEPTGTATEEPPPTPPDPQATGTGG
jgi:serine/threonine protein kinase